jgi:zinc transport system ATP-binding protein
VSQVISLRGGSFGYAGKPVMHDVDFSVSPGEVVAVLGPNGSGKSTLVRALVGLVPLLSGTLRVSRRFGYVPQRHSVGGGVPATVEEVVASGRLARRRFLPGLPAMLPVLDRGVVCDAIATVGLTEKIGQAVSSLSGGQQRRVLIARALAGEPDVLVMDEPFAGVDGPNQEILADTLRTLVEGGVTLVVVTHELGPLGGLVDRTVVIQHGRIDYDGPPTDSVLSRFGAVGDPDPHASPGSPERRAAAGNGLGIHDTGIAG